MNIAMTIINDDIATLGFAAALHKLHPSAKFFDPISKPMFDVFDELSPHIIVCHYKFLQTTNINKVLAVFPQTKLVVLTKELLDTKVADTLRLCGGTQQQRFETDISCIATTLTHQNILDINSLGSKFRLKLFIHSTLNVTIPPIVYYVGKIAIEEFSSCMTGAKYIYDLNDRLHFNVEMNNSYRFTDINETLPTGKERQQIIDQRKQHVITNKLTYLDLMEQLLCTKSES